MSTLSCEQCGQTWHVEKVGKDGWRLRESPAPWVYGWLISADRPCCPFDGGALHEARPSNGPDKVVEALPAAR